MSVITITIFTLLFQAVWLVSSQGWWYDRLSPSYWKSRFLWQERFFFLCVCVPRLWRALSCDWVCHKINILLGPIVQKLRANLARALKVGACHFISWSVNEITPLLVRQYFARVQPPNIHFSVYENSPWNISVGLIFYINPRRLFAFISI